MKAAKTPLAAFSALRETSFLHTADYQSLELRHKQEAYARIYEQYNKLLFMHEEGYTVAEVKLNTATTSLTFFDFENLINPMDYVQILGQRLTQLAEEILDLHEALQNGTLNGSSSKERAENDIRLVALKLLLPDGHPGAGYDPSTTRTA